MKRELRDLLWSEVALLTFEVNSTLRNLCDNVQAHDGTIPEIIRVVDMHEFPIIVIFPKDRDAGKLKVALPAGSCDWQDHTDGMPPIGSQAISERRHWHGFICVAGGDHPSVLCTEMRRIEPFRLTCHIAYFLPSGLSSLAPMCRSMSTSQQTELTTGQAHRSPFIALTVRAATCFGLPVEYSWYNDFL